MLDEYVVSKNSFVLSKFLFDKDLTPKQQEIVRIIAFSEHRRVCINAMTRYGKSLCVAIGVSLYLWLNENKKVAIIAPQEEQAAIIRNYIAELISSCPRLAYLVDIDSDSSIERLKKEASRKRWTFKNGCELRMISAHGEADRLLGFGADLIIKDESAKISREADTKILRMLGDDSDNSVLIELSNPWNRDNKYYEHYVSGRFYVIRIDHKIALEEGRITEHFLQEMRQELTPLEFTILYESEFPEEAEDSLLRFSWIEQATKNDFKFQKPKRIISCDPADQGRDHTVIMQGWEENGFYEVTDIYSEATSDNMGIANKIIALDGQNPADEIHIDCIGIGAGVLSRLKEVLKNKRIIACHYGESPDELSTASGNQPTSSKKRFLNKKAEQYFRLRSLFEDNRIKIPNHSKLRTELLNMKWEKSPSEKIRIIDPEEKSPDYADACCYFIWKDKKDVKWFFS